MKPRVLFLFLAALLWNNYRAQVANYSFTQTLSAYGQANTGTLVGAQLQDDDVTPVNLPFPFTFNGTTYTTVNVCSNGYLSFGSLTGTEYSAISDGSTQELIAPFAQDIFMGSVVLGDLSSGSNTISNCSSVTGFSVGDVILDWNGDFGFVNPTVTAVSGNNIVVNLNSSSTFSTWDVLNLNGYIKQSLSGTSPNQVCEFEFRNFTRFAVYDELINFKVRLYESSNKIEFLYGTMIPGIDFTQSEVGLKGLSGSDFNSRTVGSSNTWSNSAASSLISDACDFNAGKFPLSGQLYVWAPLTCTPPVVSIAQSSSVICNGSSATLTASGAGTYTWSQGGSGSVIVVSPSVTTVYSLSAGSSTCLGTASSTIQVNATPVVSISASSSLICQGGSASFTASGATSYTWSTGATGSVVSLSPSTSTFYTVTGETGTCSDSAMVSLLVVPCTGLADAQSQIGSIKTYPNPFSNLLRVEVEGTEGASLYLYDALGRILIRQSIESGSILEWNTADLEKGIYILELRSQGKNYTRKLIKE